MQMPNRQNVNIAASEDYRFAYNGMETDNEVSGEGNSYTTEFRQYDPRLGRWKSLDPLMAQFPWQSPYCAFDNNPVYYIDPYGLSATNDSDGDGPGDPPKVGPIESPNGSGGLEWKTEDGQTFRGPYSPSGAENEANKRGSTLGEVRTQNLAEVQVLADAVGYTPPIEMGILDGWHFLRYDGQYGADQTLDDLSWPIHYRNYESTYDSDGDGIVQIQADEYERIRSNMEIDLAVFEEYNKSGRATPIYPEIDILLLLEGLPRLSSLGARSTKSVLFSREAYVGVTLNSRFMSKWGWTGTKIWKDLVSKVGSNTGTIRTLNGKVASKKEATQLIEEAGGTVQRIEGPHAAPNPHSYNHINYYNASGKKATIEIKDL